MERGFSKILIEDHIIPDQNAGPRQTLLDMTVMTFCPGIERTRRRWTDLLSSVGLVIKNCWFPDGDGEGIIEAELQDKPDGMPYNVTPEDTQPMLYNHINGNTSEALDRFCVSELCKGWPVYRDASEWNNYRDLFVKDEDAYVWTSKWLLGSKKSTMYMMNTDQISLSLERLSSHRRFHQSLERWPEERRFHNASGKQYACGAQSIEAEGDWEDEGHDHATFPACRWCRRH